MSTIDRTAWDIFLAGHWTREAPTEPGTYPIAAVTDTRETTAMSIAFAYRHPSTGQVQWVNSWGGWRWSVPFPALPNVPLTRGD